MAIKVVRVAAADSTWCHVLLALSCLVAWLTEVEALPSFLQLKCLTETGGSFARMDQAVGSDSAIARRMNSSALAAWSVS